MSYAEYEQLVYLNPVLRRNIQNNLGIKQSMFDKALKELKDKGLIRKVANNTFSINPDYVGRGKWRDIRRLRATFDFITGDVQTDFGYGE
jgi:DNA-binding HxlR family transcriptional regulator